METQPIRILFLASDPRVVDKIRLGRELAEIQDRLEKRDRFELTDRWAARPRDVLNKILDKKPQIVHFAGHGMETGELCLEDDQGNVQPVSPEALAALFKLVTGFVKCVVINTCFSETQAKAIAEHIPFVIGMNKAIGDKAAVEFATGFYTSLGADPSIENIEKAFDFGRVSIQLSGIPAEHLTPVLIFGDPRRRFRSEVEQVQSRLQQTGSMAAAIFRKALQEKGKRMGLSIEEVEAITNESLELIKEFKRKLQGYEEAFTDAIRDEFPIEDETREALKFLQQELGLRQEDVAPIEGTIENDPRWQTAEAFFDRGLNQFNLGEYQKALKYYTRSIEIRPTYSSAYLERGTTHYKLDDLQAALEDYDSAIKTDNNWEGRGLEDAYFERGLAYFYSARKTEDKEKMRAAIADWTETLKVRSKYSIAYYNRACAYSELGNSEEAIKDFSQAIDINSGWGEGINLASAYAKRAL